jgi:superfamily II DNA or RNA helicase
VEVVDDYLSGPAQDGRSALITMPTGTGKTGVVASSVAFPAALEGHRLVLTPWDALVRQLIRDLDHRFWERIGEQRPPTLPPIKRLPPSSRIELIESAEEPTVFVATIAAINVMAGKCAHDGRDLATVFGGFDLVFVDEGHYEPAHRWSEVIRPLRRPTVLLTATPYRNDVKYFEIGGARYRYTHHQAVAERFLREPEFAQITRADTSSFTRELVALVADRFGEVETRVIVRCQDADAITRVVHAIEQTGHSAIGVHHTFETGDTTLRHTVPAPDATDAQFWVHQNKLIEGIDDPRFRVLAFYDPLRNDRAVVQQIGRVLRNPARARSDMTGLVVGTGDRPAKRTWDAYRRFDLQETPDAVATVPDLAKRILDAQPEAFYYDGAYRVRIDLQDPDAWQVFAFPLRTRVFRLIPERSAPSLDGLAQAAMDEWGKLDRSVYRLLHPAADSVIIPYVTAENSPLLSAGTFIEPVFGYTLMRRTGDLLFVFDARGRVPEDVSKHFRAVAPSELATLFAAGASSLRSVGLLNTDVGQQAARSRQLRAAAIDTLSPDLTDFAYVCTTAEGYVEVEADEGFRRYVGLSRARVVDHRAGERDFATYSAWLDELAAALAQPAPAVDTFTRYASEVPTPADPTPVHVLLDIDPTDFIQPDGTAERPLELEDTAYEVRDGELRIVVGDREYVATIGWDSLTEGYVLRAPALSAAAYQESGGEGRELISVINHEQALRVVPTERSAIYSHGRFYKPIVPVRQRGAFRLLDVLVPVDELDNVINEKGREIVDDDWDPASVFGLISALSANSERIAPQPLADALKSPDLLVCTDMGTEIADFIATAPQRVVFMHAKAGSGTAVSASALHDVSSQALKNLMYLQPLTEEQPKAKNWTSPWSSPHVHGRATRQRVGSFSSTDAIWRHIRSVISDPRAEREVWLVIGRSLSRSALEAQASKRKPSAEALQIYSLLQTTWGAVSQVGARVRIFCSP